MATGFKRPMALKAQPLPVADVKSKMKDDLGFGSGKIVLVMYTVIFALCLITLLTSFLYKKKTLKVMLLRLLPPLKKVGAKKKVSFNVFFYVFRVYYIHV